MSTSYNNLPELKAFRKELRNKLTPAEAALWNQLKQKQLAGVKFRRQHSIGLYIVDFYAPAKALAIELDGDYHFSSSQAEYDNERTLFLQQFGVKVLRFENELVFTLLDVVLEEIKGELEWKMYTQPPHLSR
jgi:very-short-patch-repair endonuclease